MEIPLKGTNRIAANHKDIKTQRRRLNRQDAKDAKNAKNLVLISWRPWRLGGSIVFVSGS
jgi:hypothetical protein